MYQLKTSPEMGRGLYATRQIAQNEIIMKCEILVLSENDTKIVNTTDLQYYTFKFNETQDCLVLGLGEIFNHDENSNVNYELIDFENRKIMVFKASKFIRFGKQLFINYTQDISVNADRYISNKSLTGE
jgi:SET domain-containing protein